MPQRSKKSRASGSEAGAARISQAVGSPKEGTSGAKRWGFRVASVVLIPLFVVLCIEFGLRVADYGYPTSFFLDREIAGRSVRVENEKFGWRFFGRGMARTPRPMQLPVPKPPRTCRVFVFGESAAYGDPKPEFGLPRFLEVLLRDRFPGVEFEIVNAAMTGINSHVILPIARDCAGQSGDVWVIYMGNNEVVGPFGSGTVFGQKTPPMGLIRASVFLKGTRIGEWLGQMLARERSGQAPDPEWEGMAMFTGNQVRNDDPRMRIVYNHFERNLGDILATGRSHGVGIVVSTVLSNLKDCAPFGSEHRMDLPPATLTEWNRVFDLGKKAEAASQPGQAATNFQQAATLDDQFAELQFRLGRCLLALGKDEEARAHLVLARDYDTLRFRADTVLNERIRSIAGGRSAERIQLVDAEKELAQGSPHKITGAELLYEHVHLNFHGNYALSLAIARQVLEVLPSWVTNQAQSKQSWLTEEQCAQRLAWTGWDQYRTIRSVLMRMDSPPFTSQCDHAERYEMLSRELEQLLPATRPASLREAADIYRRAVSLSAGDWVLERDLGELLRSVGDLNGAETALRKAIELLPHDPMGHLELGLLLVQSGHAEEALGQFEEVLREQPDSIGALNAKALALSQLGRHNEELQTLTGALKMKPHAADTRMNLASALESAGRRDEAREQFRLAVQDKLKTPDLLVRAGKICMLQGWVDQGITNFSRALMLNPTDANVHWYLGGALDTKGATAEAEHQFSEAVRLDPGFANGHVGLGIELSRQGRDHEAEQEFTRALQIDPKLTDARLRLGVSLLRQRQIHEAREQFEQVLAIQPTNSTAQQYLLRIAKGQPSPP